MKSDDADGADGAWIINIWMRQEKISDKKFSLVIISDHVTSVKPMGIF